MATSGPGCGGTRPCITDRPASAGMPTLISDRPERRATRKMIGISSTRPISKNIGSPISAPTSAIAQGRVRVLDAADDGVGDLVAAAGVGEQLAEHRAQRDQGADAGGGVAEALEVAGDGRRDGQPGDAGDHERADGQREERVHLEAGDQHDDQRDADQRRHDERPAGETGGAVAAWASRGMHGGIGSLPRSETALRRRATATRHWSTRSSTGWRGRARRRARRARAARGSRTASQQRRGHEVARAGRPDALPITSRRRRRGGGTRPSGAASRSRSR